MFDYLPEPIRAIANDLLAKPETQSWFAVDGPGCLTALTYRAYEVYAQQQTPLEKINAKLESMQISTPPLSGFIPISNASRELDLSEDRVRHLCYQRRIKFIKQGKGLYFRPEWISEFIKSGDYSPNL
ncbi:MAG TPA: hypothetical protein VLM37_10325, partial [Fibrobacteraceae bacterium]|nr:hypothetical protein [Fibrobacteraceae bacterium]